MAANGNVTVKRIEGLGKTISRLILPASENVLFVIITDQLDQIRKMTLAKIICRNTGISRIQRRALEEVQSG